MPPSAGAGANELGGTWPLAQRSNAKAGATPRQRPPRLRLRSSRRRPILRVDLVRDVTYWLIVGACWASLPGVRRGVGRGLGLLILAGGRADAGAEPATACPSEGFFFVTEGPKWPKHYLARVRQSR
jgi:hypothetical protein